jgi:hypothetical protein
MRVKPKIAAMIFFFFPSQIFFAEEGIATLINEVTIKPGTEVTSLITYDEDIAAGFSDGSVFKIGRDLVSKGEIARASSRITSIALSRNKQYMAIATSGHGTLRYEREYFGSSYKQSNIRFGYPVSPVKSLAFDPTGAYLITADSTGRGSVYINEDGKKTNSGNGNLIGPIFSNDKRVFGVVPFSEAKMIYLFSDIIASYDYSWNKPSSEAEKEPAKAEKAPELLLKTETILFKGNAVYATLDSLKSSLYYVTRNDSSDKLFKYSLNDKITTLLYVFDKQINSIAATDGMDVYIAFSDRIAIIRDEHTIISLENASDVSVSLYVNNKYERALTPNTKIELIRRPGPFQPSVTSSNGIVYFESYDVKQAFDLKDKENLSLTIQRQYPLQIIPVESKKLKTNDAAVSEQHNLHAVTVNHNNDEGNSLLVMDTNTHRILYQQNYTSNTTKFLFHGNILCVADQNNVYAYGIRSGKLENTWQTIEDIQALTAFGNRILALGFHTIVLIDIATNSIQTFPNDRGLNITACLTNENTYIVSKANATEVYKIENGKTILFHRIPASWIGVPKHIIPMRRDAFSILTIDNKLKTFNGDPEQIEPLSFQFNESLEFQFFYKKGEIIFLRFINRKENRIEDYDIEIPGKTANYYYINPKIIKVYGNDTKILGKTMNGDLLLYTNERFRGTYYVFDDLNSAFITPGSDRENDKYSPGSEIFKPYTYFRIRQNKDERNFLPEDNAKTIGG